MALKSVLNPETIVGRQNTNKQATQKFISGGSILGSSVVNSAANKIVGFQRANVQPAPSAVGNVVNNISTSINNNVTTTVNKTLQSIVADYQKRVSQVDSSKPIGILGKFLSSYKAVIKFINFFGNKKNINRLRDNLETLKKSFTESFEVAKIIRQVIIKIVKQLSNLPKASPSGGGGLNLDIDIPGGGLKKSAPRGLGRMMKGKAGMLGIGALGLGAGAVGANAVNALSDSGQVQPAATEPQIPGDLVDKFSSIVDRFSNIINSLIKGSSKKPSPSSSSSSSSGSNKKTEKKGPPGSPGSSGGQLLPGDAPPEIKALMSTISGGEGGADSVNAIGPVSGLSDMSFDEAIAKGNQYKKSGKSTGAIGSFQFKPEYLRDRAIAAGIDPSKDKFNLENQTKVMRHFQTTVYGGSEEKLLQSLRSGGLESDVFPKLSKDLGWPSLPGGNQPNVHTKGSGKRYEDYLKLYDAPVSAQQRLAAAKPEVIAAPTQATTQQQLAQEVSQAPASQQPQMNILPMNFSGGGEQQQTGGGGITAPSPPERSGPSVPLLPSSNPDNFLVLYSKMVYNIVDG